MTKRLGWVVAPHEAQDADKVAELAAKYDAGDAVTPPVVVVINDGLYAVSGSHRLAAMLEVFDPAVDVEGWERIVLVDGDELYEAAGDEQREWLDRLVSGRVGDFGDLVNELWDAWPDDAREALEDQRA